MTGIIGPRMATLLRPAMTTSRRLIACTVLYSSGALRLAAQCPDGTPPPCRTATVARAVAAPPPLSIAVLPFENRSPDTADVYLADGVTEEVANRLTQLGKLKVKARGLVAAQMHRTPDAFDAARRLGVAWFVHGNVRHVSGQLLVNVELVRATTGEEAWAYRFPRRDNDVFAVQAEVAESVAVHVGGRLTPGERAVIARRPTRDNEAYRLYLFGNSLFARRTQPDIAQSIDAYTHAVELDPSFAAAWARIGMARGVQESWGWEVGLSADSLIQLARAGARRALALDSAQAEAWLAAGFAEALSGNLYLAHDAYEHAIHTDSLNAEAFHFFGVLYAFDCPLGTCLVNEAAGIPLLRRALALDPTLRNSWRHLSQLEMVAGRLAEAETHLDTALSFGPWARAFEDRAYVRMLRDDLAGARRDLDAAAAATGGQDSLAERPALLSLLSGDSAPARAIVARGLAAPSGDLQRLIESAKLLMALGRRDSALDAVEQLKAADNRSSHCTPRAACSPSLVAWQTIRDPVFAPLRGDPRYDRLYEDLRPRIPWLQENR